MQFTLQKPSVTLVCGQDMPVASTYFAHTAYGQHAEIVERDKCLGPAIGHSDLDEEHQCILGFAMFCLLTCPEIESRRSCEGCLKGKPEHCQSGLFNVLDYLLPYLHRHFAYEEQAMRDAQLASQDLMHMTIHLSAHNYLLQQFKALGSEFQAAQPGNDLVRQIRRLHDLITNNLLDHVIRVDSRLAPYLPQSPTVA